MKLQTEAVCRNVFKSSEYLPRGNWTVSLYIFLLFICLISLCRYRKNYKSDFQVVQTNLLKKSRLSCSSKCTVLGRSEGFAVVSSINLPYLYCVTNILRIFKCARKMLFRFLFTLNALSVLLSHLFLVCKWRSFIFATDRWPSVIRKWLVRCFCPLVIKNVRVTQRCKTKSACCGRMPSCLIKELSYLPVRTTVSTNTITEAPWSSVKPLWFSPGLY